MIFSLISLLMICTCSSFQIRRYPVQMKMHLNLMDDPKEVLLSKSLPYSNAEINEFILELERINPTFQPAHSELLNGIWERVYFNNDISNIDIGSQALKLILPGADIEEVPKDFTLSISEGDTQPRITTEANFMIDFQTLGIVKKVVVSVDMELQIMSASLIKMSYMNLRMDDKEPDIDDDTDISLCRMKTRELTVTYIDRDILIMRNENKSPEIHRRQTGDFDEFYD
mmetsp:Transcript_3794/g.3942  ORF Transcript_3794/g.3942 Transcript_3794/m.3942 type:complete len:228 (+) Transcript_3794:86-769(+)